MPKLILSSESASKLLSLAAGSQLPETIRSELADALLPAARGDPDQPEATGDPGDLPALPPVPLTVVHHRILARVASALRERGNSEPTLASLVRGAQVYHPPRPGYKRPPELDALLARIQAAQDKTTYAAMVQGKESVTTAQREQSGLPRGYTPVVPHEPELLSTPEQDDKETWRQIRSALSAIASVLLSMAGVVTGVWQAGGTASVAWKTLVALFLALVVAGAETFLYMRAFGFFEPAGPGKPPASDPALAQALPTATLPDEATLVRLKQEQDKAVDEYLTKQSRNATTISHEPAESRKMTDTHSSAVAGHPSLRKRKGRQK